MNHDHTKHMFLMLACCLVPFALILAVSVFGLSLGALQPLVPFALVLMCPLMMIFMMRGTLAPHARPEVSAKSAGVGHDHSAADAHQHPMSTQHTEVSQSTQLAETKTPVEQKSCH
ncbi:MAG: DUF2933 domain-containing protein [Chloroflexi bacterium]|nr:DUF2933 domain-containing protein [Chloroflexota bacterium]